MTQNSLLAVLASELDSLAPEIDRLAEGICAGEEAAVGGYLTVLERLGNVGEMLELPVLGALSSHLVCNVASQIGKPEQADLIRIWPHCFKAFLEAPDEQDTRAALTQSLTSEQWPEPMDENGVAELQRTLSTYDSHEQQKRREPRQFVDADITLTLAADLTAEMRAAFEHEAPHYASLLNSHLASIDSDRNQDEIIEALRQARRAAHTLKGSAALVGLHAVVNLTHLLEELLELLHQQGRAPDSGLLIDLRGAGDALEEMVEASIGMGNPPANIQGLLHRIDGWIMDLQPNTSGHFETMPEFQDDQAERSTDPATPVTDAPSEASARVPVAESSGESGAPSEARLSVPVRIIDEMLRAMGELMVQMGHLHSAARDSVDRSERLSRQLFVLQQSVQDIEHLIDLRGTPAFAFGQHPGSAATASGRNGTPGPGDSGFDPLELDDYNQLHSMTRQFSERALDGREMAHDLHDRLTALQNLVFQQQRLGREVNSSILASRMVRVDTQAGRWQRIVRQVCQTTGKRATLEIEGATLAIDTDILNAVSEPLMHLLRNAVDHGIEPAAEREALGKPSGGNLRLRFAHDGSRIQVEMEDDGGGLNEPAIIARAQSLGLLERGQKVDSERLARLVLTPGFSTRTEASEISGRGIGLDAASMVVQQMGGALELESRPGRGLRVRMRLPQSLSSSHLLFVRVGEARYALPSLAVRQVLYSDAGTIESIGESPVFQHDDQSYPLTRLADLLHVPGEHTLDSLAEPRPLVLAESGGGPIALLVDGVIESREAVIKSLSEHIPELRGISGACILADGDLAMVVDLAHVNRRRKIIEPFQPPDARPQAAATVLVVDDSLSARRFLSGVVADLGMDAVTAFDGLDALEKIEQQRPDLLLLDLEMPRMNGLELTAQLRREPDTADLPVIMITSRSTIKHREKAELVGVNHYLTKPYQEEQLEALILESLRSTADRTDP